MDTGLQEVVALAAQAARESTLVWFECFGMIRRKSGDLVTPRANVYQERIAAVIEAARTSKRPCRLVCLKPRQKGSSTYSVAELYRGAQRRGGKRGLIAGGAHFQGQNLFKILKTYADNDSLDVKTCKVMDMEARFANGSEIERLTLANPNAGRSGTYQMLVVTEVAYLSEEGVANADEVLNGLLKCVPYEEDTLIIEESTAKGASGFFYDRWQGAITVEEFLAGKNGYVKVFAAWYEFDDSRMSPAAEGISSWEDVTSSEMAYVEDVRKRLGVELALDQVAWMRWALRTECNGDLDRFNQDYPSDPETAFVKSGACRFSAEGLEYQRRRSRECAREFGSLEYRSASDTMVWVSSSEAQARAVRWEQPRVGCHYLISVDPMTGASQTGGDDPDSHAVLVWRKGYMQHGRWHEPALVMRNALHADGVRFGCWWDIDVLEEEVWRMARYWQAIIVPEMNMDRGLVELLKLRGDVDIYQREMFNRREQVRTKALGWMTDTKTRGMIIEQLARGIREAGRGNPGEGIELRCPWLIRECSDFVVKPNGRAEAAPGKHDDGVLSACIGYYTLDSATPWQHVERLEAGEFAPVRKTRHGQWG